MAGLFVVMFKATTFFLIKIPFIILLLIFGRKSLALYLWGKGRIMTWIAKRNDADPGMYRRPRWKKNTRAQVYARVEKANGGYFKCDVSGIKSTSLVGFHVDHKLPRSQWPYLAYEQWNLRLVTARINRNKSDDVHWWFLVKFVFMKRC